MRKKMVVRWELDGVRVTAGTAGAKKKKQFVGYVQKVDGKEIMLGRVLETARLVLAERLREAQLRKHGVAPEISGANHAMGELIDLFITNLEARERSSQYLRETRFRLKVVAKDLAWARAGDARLEELESWIASKRREGSRFSVETSNSYRASWRAWGNWMVKTGRALYSPFRAVEKMNSEPDRRHVRRPLTPEEVQLLLETVEHGPERAGMGGPMRAMLYRVAVSTGLRASELASLTPASFLLDENPPHIALEARFSKNRRRALQPVPKALAGILKAFLARMPKGAPIWACADPHRNKLGAMLRRDCEQARGAHPSPPAGFLESRPGAVIDFHSLRGTFLSALASRVSASTLGALGRHASVQTTQRHYVRHQLTELAESLNHANVSWFSHGSPDIRKTMKRDETKVDHAARLIRRFMECLKPNELNVLCQKVGIAIVNENG